MLSQPKNGGLVLSPEQIADKKRKQEEEQRAKTLEFRTKKEALMREVGVIEVAIIKFDPMNGVTPDSVILPYTWKEGETFLPVPVNNTEKSNGNKKPKKAK